MTKIVLDSGRMKINLLHSVSSNRDIYFSTYKLLLLAVIRHTLEYIWKEQSASLESVVLGTKSIFSCSRTCSRFCVHTEDFDKRFLLYLSRGFI